MLNAVVNNGFDVAINYGVVFFCLTTAYGLKRLCFDKIRMFLSAITERVDSVRGDSVRSNLGGDFVWRDFFCGDSAQGDYVLDSMCQTLFLCNIFNEAVVAVDCSSTNTVNNIIRLSRDFEMQPETSSTSQLDLQGFARL